MPMTLGQAVALSAAFLFLPWDNVDGARTHPHPST